MRVFLITCMLVNGHQVSYPWPFHTIKKCDDFHIYLRTEMFPPHEGKTTMCKCYRPVPTPMRKAMKP
jgi:hypothetical protein